MLAASQGKLWRLPLPELIQKCQHAWAGACYWLQTNQSSVDYSGNPENRNMNKAQCKHPDWLETTSLGPGIDSHMAPSPAQQIKFAVLLSGPKQLFYMAQYWLNLLHQMSSAFKNMLCLLLQHLHDFWGSITWSLAWVLQGDYFHIAEAPGNIFPWVSLSTAIKK